MPKRSEGRGGFKQFCVAREARYPPLSLRDISPSRVEIDGRKFMSPAMQGMLGHHMGTVSVPDDKVSIPAMQGMLGHRIVARTLSDERAVSIPAMQGMLGHPKSAAVTWRARVSIPAMQGMLGHHVPGRIDPGFGFYPCHAGDAWPSNPQFDGASL